MLLDLMRRITPEAKGLFDLPPADDRGGWSIWIAFWPVWHRASLPIQCSKVVSRRQAVVCVQLLPDLVVLQIHHARVVLHPTGLIEHNAMVTATLTFDVHFGAYG